MTILSKQSIFSAPLPHEDVPVPEWGGDVRVAVMTGAMRDRLMALQANDAPDVPSSVFEARLLICTVIDENNQPLFGEEDIEALRNLSRDAVERVLDVAMRLNKVAPAAVEDEVKNSDADPSGDSGSASQSTSESLSANSSNE